jgi:hypothetical protein
MVKAQGFTAVPIRADARYGGPSEIIHIGYTAAGPPVNFQSMKKLKIKVRQINQSMQGAYGSLSVAPPHLQLAILSSFRASRLCRGAYFGPSDVRKITSVNIRLVNNGSISLQTVKIKDRHRKFYCSNVE